MLRFVELFRLPLTFYDVIKHEAPLFRLITYECCFFAGLLRFKWELYTKMGKIGRKNYEIKKRHIKCMSTLFRLTSSDQKSRANQ